MYLRHQTPVCAIYLKYYESFSFLKYLSILILLRKPNFTFFFYFLYLNTILLLKKKIHQLNALIKVFKCIARKNILTVLNMSQLINFYIVNLKKMFHILG